MAAHGPRPLRPGERDRGRRRIPLDPRLGGRAARDRRPHRPPAAGPRKPRADRVRGACRPATPRLRDQRRPRRHRRRAGPLRRPRFEASPAPASDVFDQEPPPSDHPLSRFPTWSSAPTTPASARKPRSAWRSPPPATPSPPSTASSTPRWWSTARSCKGAQIQPSARSTGSPPRVCSGSAGSKMAWHVHAPVQDAHDVDAGGDLAVEDHVSAARVLSIAPPYGAGGPPEPRIMREQPSAAWIWRRYRSAWIATPPAARMVPDLARSACARGERT